MIPRSTLCLALAAVCLSPVAAQAQKRDLSKGNTLYVVPYAHLDTQWRWAYPQVIREYIYNTLNDNFKLIEKYPNYVFNFSGSRRYEMMKEYYPSEYEQLKKYVKTGRWFPCGSSVDENDANVPSGESQLRHVLYGNQYFKKEFGIVSSEFMLPDCFGFPYALPSILAHCGLNGFSTQKLTWGSANGIPFKVGRWIGPDGSSVVAALDPGAYVGVVDEDLSQNTSWLARIQNTGKQSGAYVDYHYYGTGDTGGAPGEGSVQWVERSIAGKGPIKVVSTRADEMFNVLTPQQIAKLPVYRGELLLTEHSAGSVTSQAYMKRWNRHSELLADAAERASVAAMWLGGAAYPSKRLYDAWDLVLGTQMHDMLPGTSIPKAYEFCWNDYLLAQNMFASVATDAVGAVTAAMDTRGRGTSLVVFNPLSVAREDVVEAHLHGQAANAQVYGPDGTAVPTQTLGSDTGGTRILFRAKVPANGFASFDVRKERYSERGRGATDRSLDNGRLKVTINKAGDIASIYDKVNKREALKSPVRLSFHYHNPAAFPAWNMDWADAKLPPRGYVDGPATIRLVESGPVRQTIEVTREAMGSKFVQRISLTAGSDQVIVNNTIDWNTYEMALKATFPLTTGNPKATYDLQLGAIERGNNDPKKYEVPQHQWLDLTKPDKSYGVGILNDSKFGSDKPDNDTVRLTLLYTPGVRGGYRDQRNQDFGRHEIAYAITPHKGDWRVGDVAWKAKRFNQPLRAFVVPKHPGRLGKSFSLFSTNSPQVEIQAIKKAEESGEVIVRLRELTGRPATNVVLKAAGPIVSAREVDGQEHPLRSAPVKSGVMVRTIPGYGLRTYALKLAAAQAKVAAPQSQPINLPYDVDVASTDSNRNDGLVEGALSMPAELLPASTTVGGINFKLGSTKDGAKNALRAMGQRISIPAGYDRVYVLAASASGKGSGTFGIGTKQVPVTVSNWAGYVGQWDNRLWTGDPGPNFTNYGEWAGLVPGWVNQDQVAWYASHRHTPQGNTFYDYCYLFKYGFDVPKGATSIKLPNNPNIKIFAISVARNTNDGVTPAGALYDTLEDRKMGGKTSISYTGKLNEGVFATIRPPLYWQGSIYYTLDGSTPTLQSEKYKDSIFLTDPTTIKAAIADGAGRLGPVTSYTINVRDTTAPRVVSATTPAGLAYARVDFSEKVAASAEDASNYTIAGTSVIAAKLSSDARFVELTLDKPLPSGASRITIRNVRDLAKSPNTVASVTTEIASKPMVLSVAEFEPKKHKVIQEPKLPVRAKDRWTLSFLCRIDAQPDNRTIIAGFGRAVDGQSGAGRYFTKFPRGINFWVSNRDVMTNTPLDLGKWQMLTATYDGATLRVYKNGVQIGQRTVELDDDVARAEIMPMDAWERQRQFAGEVRDFMVWGTDLPAGAVKKLWEEASKRLGG